MDVFKLRDQLIHDYAAYITSYINMKDTRKKPTVEETLNEGLLPNELINILDRAEEVKKPFDPQGYAARCVASTFPGETFRVLKEKETRQYGEYRTRRLVLEAWNRLQESIENGSEYVPMVDPPPADPSVAHPPPERQQPMQQREQITIPDPPKTRKEEGGQASAKAVEFDFSQEEDPEVEEKADTPTDYGLYKCQVCGKLVMGYARSEHVDEKHGGQAVEWKKVSKQ